MNAADDRLTGEEIMQAVTAAAYCYRRSHLYDDIISELSIELLRVEQWCLKEAHQRHAKYQKQWAIGLFRRFAKTASYRLHARDRAIGDRDAESVGHADLTNRETPDELVEAKDERHHLRERVERLISQAGLTSRELIAIRTYYGLDNGHCLTRKETAQALGVELKSIDNALTDAKRKLRRTSGETNGNAESVSTAA